jgi:YVTN family beta-propeller protein
VEAEQQSRRGAGEEEHLDPFLDSEKAGFGADREDDEGHAGERDRQRGQRRFRGRRGVRQLLSLLLSFSRSLSIHGIGWVAASDMPLRIFIAYRRDDSQGFARSIHDRLALHFGRDAVFRDINDLEPGRPWEEAIDGALGACDVFVLLIGPRWLDASDDEGHRRIDDPQDRHRREIETAIERRIRTFVALMEDARMPRKAQLPSASEAAGSEGLQKLPGLHALRIADHAFDYGVGELVANIERAAEQQSAEAGESPAPVRREPAVQRQTREEGEPKPGTGPSERTRRIRMIAALGAGALIVVVGALLLVTRGAESDSATVAGPAIEVGADPVDLASGEGGVWVTNRASRSLSLIGDGDPAKVIDTVNLDGPPEGVTVGSGFVWVAEPGPSRVWQIGPEGDVVDEIRVGGTPGDLAIDEEALWVANSGSNSVSRIGLTEADTIDVGAQPYGVAIGAEAVWVTNRGDDSVSRIPEASDVADEPIAVGDNPKGIAVSDEAVWVANTDDDTVSRIDLTDLGAEPAVIEVGNEPGGVASAFGSVWVANRGSNSVSRIDPEQQEVVDEVAVGDEPDGITAGSDSIWVANAGAGTVTRIKP